MKFLHRLLPALVLLAVALTSAAPAARADITANRAYVLVTAYPMSGIFHERFSGIEAQLLLFQGETEVARFPIRLAGDSGGLNLAPAVSDLVAVFRLTPKAASFKGTLDELLGTYNGISYGIGFPAMSALIGVRSADLRSSKGHALHLQKILESVAFDLSSQTLTLTKDEASVSRHPSWNEKIELVTRDQLAGKEPALPKLDAEPVVLFDCLSSDGWLYVSTNRYWKNSVLVATYGDQLGQERPHSARVKPTDPAAPGKVEFTDSTGSRTLLSFDLSKAYQAYRIQGSSGTNYTVTGIASVSDDRRSIDGTVTCRVRGAYQEFLPLLRSW